MECEPLVDQFDICFYDEFVALESILKNTKAPINSGVNGNEGLYMS